MIYEGERCPFTPLTLRYKLQGFSGIQIPHEYQVRNYPYQITNRGILVNNEFREDLETLGDPPPNPLPDTFAKNNLFECEMLWRNSNFRHFPELSFSEFVKVMVGDHLRGGYCIKLCGKGKPHYYIYPDASFIARRHATSREWFTGVLTPKGCMTARKAMPNAPHWYFNQYYLKPDYAKPKWL